MRRTLPLLFAAGLLACSCLTNALGRPTEQISPTRTAPPAASATPAPTGTPTAEPTSIAGPGFTVVRVYPSDGDLNEQLAAQAEKATELGQDAYVEFDATWCPACRALKESLDEEDELMVDAFQGVYLIRADIDDWGYFLERSGFEFDAIPIIFQVDDQGYPTGEWIDGSAWEENTPENMAPPLKEFFRSH
jgi:thiol-disulfide isomerase/thioredoxin